MRFTIGHHSSLLHSSPQPWSVHLLCGEAAWCHRICWQAPGQAAKELLAFQQHHPSPLKMPHPSPTNTQQLLSSWAIQIAPLPQHEDISWALKQNISPLEGCQGLPTETCPSISLGCQTAKHKNSSHSDRLTGQDQLSTAKNYFRGQKSGFTSKLLCSRWMMPIKLLCFKADLM